MDFHYGSLIFHLVNLVIPISLWNNMDYPIFIIPLYDPNNQKIMCIPLLSPKNVPLCPKSWNNPENPEI